MTLDIDTGRLEFRDQTGYINLIAAQDIPANRLIAFDREFRARLLPSTGLGCFECR